MSNKREVLHIIPHFGDKAAGPSYSVPKLCNELSDNGFDVELSCLESDNKKYRFKVKIHKQIGILRKFAISYDFFKYLKKESYRFMIIHNHSLWSMVNITAGFFSPFKKSKLVASPRGTLSNWALSQKKYIKKILWVIQKRIFENADLIHVTSEDEYNQVRALGFTKPVTIIPNGIDVININYTKTKRDFKRLLFLGRIHPTKCLDRVLYALSKVESSSVKFTIAGKGDAKYVDNLKKICKHLNLDNVSFVGPVFGDEKAKLFIDSDLFILPSHSENFGVAIAESLAYSCPVIVSKGTPWKEVEERNCGWWINNDIESISETLNLAFKKDVNELETMGCNGKKLILERYDWKSVGIKMSISYQWILGIEAKTPNWIKLQ